MLLRCQKHLNPSYTCQFYYHQNMSMWMFTRQRERYMLLVLVFGIFLILLLSVILTKEDFPCYFCSSLVRMPWREWCTKCILAFVLCCHYCCLMDLSSILIVHKKITMWSDTWHVLNIRNFKCKQTFWNISNAGIYVQWNDNLVLPLPGIFCYKNKGNWNLKFKYHIRSLTSLQNIHKYLFSIFHNFDVL